MSRSGLSVVPGLATLAYQGVEAIHASRTPPRTRAGRAMVRFKAGRPRGGRRSRLVVIGVALHAEHAGVVRDRREQDRLDVIASIEEEFAGVERVGLVADQDRDDRRDPADDDQAQVGQAVAEPLDVRVEPARSASYSSERRMSITVADRLEIGGGRPGRRRRRSWSGS